MRFGRVGIADITLPAVIGSNMVMQCSTHATLRGGLGRGLPGYGLMPDA